jgi:Putative addiction module component.
MSVILKQLEKDVLALPLEEQFHLIDRIYSNLNPEMSKREEAWTEEATSRAVAYDRGELETVDADTAIKQAWDLLKK